MPIETDKIVTHSPGPWRMWAADGYWVIIDANDEKVADTLDLLKSMEEQTGNAYLLTAAPDLYRALKTLLDAEPGKDRDIGHEIEQAEAAIQKAEGRES